MLIDDTISWNYHISRNSGTFLKLRHYISLQQLKQLYHNLIYPYLSYAVISWSSAYTSHLKKIQVKQNHIIRVLFFATLYGKSTESVLPLMNLLDISTVEKCFSLQLLTRKFSNQWHKKQPQAYLMNTFTVQVMFILTIPVMPQKGTFIKHV